MATITITVSSGTVNGSKTFNLSDAHMQNILDYAAFNYQRTLPATPTNQQILLAWINDWLNVTKDSERNFRVNKAREQAGNSVAPIVVT